MSVLACSSIVVPLCRSMLNSAPSTVSAIVVWLLTLSTNEYQSSVSEPSRQPSIVTATGSRPRLVAEERVPAASLPLSPSLFGSSHPGSPLPTGSGASVSMRRLRLAASRLFTSSSSACCPAESTCSSSHQLPVMFSVRCTIEVWSVCAPPASEETEVVMSRVSPSSSERSADSQMSTWNPSSSWPRFSTPQRISSVWPGSAEVADSMCSASRSSVGALMRICTEAPELSDSSSSATLCPVSTSTTKWYVPTRSLANWTGSVRDVLLPAASPCTLKVSSSTSSGLGEESEESRSLHSNVGAAEPPLFWMDTTTSTLCPEVALAGALTDTTRRFGCCTQNC